MFEELNNDELIENCYLGIIIGTAAGVERRTSRAAANSERRAAIAFGAINSVQTGLHRAFSILMRPTRPASPQLSISAVTLHRSFTSAAVTSPQLIAERVANAARPRDALCVKPLIK